MEKKWLKYLSESGNEELIPLMEKFFNDELSLEDLNCEVYDMGLVTLGVFEKEEMIKNLLGN